MKIYTTTLLAAGLVIALCAAVSGQVPYPGVMHAAGPVPAGGVMHAGGFDIAQEYPGMQPVIPAAAFRGLGTGCRACGGLGCGHCRGCKSCDGSGCDACGGCDSCGGVGCNKCGSFWGNGCLGQRCGSCGGAGCKDCCGKGKWWWLGGCLGGCLSKHYRVRAETVGLWREVSDPVNYGGLTTENLDFEADWGLRTAVEIQCGDCNSLELVYLGLQNWDDDRGVIDETSGLFSPWTNTIPGFNNGFFHQIAYSSELHTAEANYWMPLGKKGHLALMAGFRWLGLREEFRYSALGVTGHGALVTETENDLMGAQIGWMVNKPLHCNWNIRWEGKAGMFVNVAEQNTLIVVGALDPQFDTNFVEQVDNNTEAFVGETSVMLNYRVTCCLSIYAGYYAMWVDGVALAAEQLNTTFPVMNRRSNGFINDGGSVFFQGPVFGLEIVR